jgi:CRP-like cAMP-binding protein
MSLTSLDRLLFIRQVPIFRELRDDFLMRLAPIMEEMYFNAGYAILTEGQDGRSMYIVVSGRVSVHLKGQEVAQFKPGDCFGEMSVFDTAPRSASVTSLTPCTCLVLNQQQLYDAIDETPGIAVNIIRLLSRRIRELNQDLNRSGSMADQGPGLETKPGEAIWYTPTMASSQPQRSLGSASNLETPPRPEAEELPYGPVLY